MGLRRAPPIGDVGRGAREDSAVAHGAAAKIDRAVSPAQREPGTCRRRVSPLNCIRVVSTCSAGR